jgi:hypothetical protein
MGSGEVAVFVLDEMQMLDQEVAPARPVSQKALNLFKSGGVDLTTFRGLPGAPSAATGTVKTQGLGTG